MDNLIDHFKKQMIEKADKTAFCFYHSDKNAEQISFRELHTDCETIAQAISTLTNYQDRILLVFPPGLELIRHLLGCIFAGRIAILTYPPADKKAIIKLKHIFEDAKPSLILTTSLLATKFKQLLKFNKLNKYFPLASLVLGNKNFSKELLTLELENCPILSTEQLQGKTAYSEQAISANHLAFIQYTSGTTRSPKGVMVSHENLLHNLSLIQECYQLKSDDVVSLWLPPYHDMGLIGGIFTAVFNGITTHLMSPLDFLKQPTTWLRSISKNKATITCMPNFGYEYCTNKITSEELNTLDLSSLRCALSGSEPIHKRVLDKFYKKFSTVGFDKKVFCPCYGLAEATLFVSGKPCQDNYKVATHKNNQVSLYTADDHMFQTTKGEDIFVSCGHPFQEVRIINSENGSLCPDGETGEIWIASPSVALGYWDNSAETEKVFRNTLHDSSKNYLNSGDIGFIYQNELFICSRSKDLIIVRGKNYYPQDIEYTINHCHELIKKGCVAVYAKKSQDKENVCVAAELKKNIEGEELETIAQAIRYHVSQDHELHLSQIDLIAANSIPKTTSGKICRQAIADLIHEKAVKTYYHWEDIVQPLENTSQESENSAEDIQTVIPKMLSHLLNLPDNRPIDLKQNFHELGMDSLLIVELYHGLSERYPQKNISIEKFIECKSLQHVIDLFNNSNESLHQEQQLPSKHLDSDIFQKCYSDEGFFASERQNKDHYYSEPILEGACDRIMKFKGQEVLVWSLNDYLGLAGDERIKQACMDVVKNYSVAYPMGSRLLTGHTADHEVLEEQLARFANKQSALLCNYGYQGLLGIMSSLVGPYDHVIIDNFAHSCIVDGAKLAAHKKQNLRVFKHNDMQHLETILQQIRRHHSGGILIVTDGVYGMTGDTAPIDQLVALKQKYQARLLVDDAHGFGVMGETGKGTGEFYQQQDGIDLYFATFAKTMAGIGGFVAGDTQIIDYLKWNSKATIFSKNLPLIYVKSTEKALQIIQQEPERLQHLKQIVKRLQDGLKNLGYNLGRTQSIITPVYLDNIELDKAKMIMKTLREQYHIFVSAVTYPVIEPGKLLIRIVPTYKHTIEDVDYTLNAFKELLALLK